MVSAVWVLMERGLLFLFLLLLQLVDLQKKKEVLQFVNSSEKMKKLEKKELEAKKQWNQIKARMLNSFWKQNVWR